MNQPQPHWNPYVAGVALGLVLLGSYLLMGYGIGASSAATRLAVAGADLVAPAAVESNPYFSQYFDGGSPLHDWMMYEVLGVFLGGLVGAYTAGRTVAGDLDRGPTTSRWTRVAFAVIGGFAMGFGARLARGCTSGQALTGGAVLSVGSWVFMMAVFAGGYATAPFFRRQWR